MSERRTALLAEIMKQIAPVIDNALDEYEAQERKREDYDKTVYATKDIMDRYSVATATAQKIIREAKFFSGGGKLGKGKILWSELAAWEERMR